MADNSIQAVNDGNFEAEVLTASNSKPVMVDLPKLWSELGVKAGGDGVEFDAKAPLAKIREAIAGDEAGSGAR